MRQPLSPWVAVAAFFTPAVAAQQIVELDYPNGRMVISDEWNREMLPDIMTVDWERRILYIRDIEEPEGVMVFSLETGEWLRTISTPKGDGPNEFPHGARALGLAPHGGIYASGFTRVIEYDRTGRLLKSWRPVTPATWTVCDFGGAPAVPTQGGVVRRGLDGTDEEVGPVRANGENITAPSNISAAVLWRVLWSRIGGCTEDRAYVALTSERGSDTVFVYHRDGTADTLTMPTEGIPGMTKCRPIRGRYRPGMNRCPVALSMLYPSLDDLGNLVLLGFDNKVHGIILDPETGCHALIRNTTRLYNMPARIYADSALVFHSGTVEVEINGEMVKAFRDTAYGVSMVPIRRVEGNPCPGMLPSVK